MLFKNAMIAGVSYVLFTAAAFAQDIAVTDSYARSASPLAKAGAAFLVIENHSGEVDRLIGVASTAAKRAQLHTHKENADGVMSMVHVEGGFELPAHGMIMMDRGGDHVMLMGLTGPFEEGEVISLVLSFEKAGDVVVEVPIDLARKPGAAHSHGHAD